MNVEWNVTDNTGNARDELEQKLALALETVGMVAEGYAKDNTPVDTGRLRNSISHAIDNHDVYIGTNVEYAPYIENGTTKIKPFYMLRDAATQHGDEYKNIVEAALKTI